MKYEYEDYVTVENNMTTEEIIKTLKYIKRGYIPDYNFTGDEDDFERFKIHIAMNKAINIIHNLHVTKHGRWQTKTVKKFCAPDCWYEGVFAIEGSWNEEEGSWLEEQGGFCSECGKQDKDYDAHNYCPYCGAKIESVQLDCELLREVCRILEELKGNDEE